MNTRLEQLVELLPKQKLDAILISKPENRRYLSGFTGSAGYLIAANDHAMLATDSRYTEQATHQAPDFEVQQIRGGWDWLLELLKITGLKRLGFESHHLTVSAHQSLLQVLKEEIDIGQISIIATSNIVEELRAIKDREELTMLQKAIDASDAAMEAVCPAIQVGMSEREVAWRMEVAMRASGADGTSFDTIVAAGPNGAMAHHQPSDRLIYRGEPVVIDMGARVGGYCSDITRTVIVGEPDDQFRRVYDTVLGAQLTAINTVRTDMTGEECDNLSRSVITEAGYGDNFGHGLGHGVGLEIHEFPSVGPKSSDKLVSNMIFTIEPGIYISGWGGIRIEDVVILSETGATQLSKASK
jgi:Xaa-Pro aminopeptidase